jgi:predicted amidohydrolase
MKVAAIQITSKSEPSDNLDKIYSLAQGHEFDVLFLPEVFYSMPNADFETRVVVEDKDENFQKIAQIAIDHNCFLLGGSVTFREQGKLFNRVLNFNPKGELINYYNKRMMFSCDLADGKNVFFEGKKYTAGSTAQTIEIDDYKIGINVCFDLRFAALFREYFDMGCNVISCSSAFTHKTGMAHWHTLLSARAIETQSYIIAANQFGHHNDKIHTYGHSLIIDPWGEVVADAGEGEKIITADLDLALVKSVRSKIHI